MASALIWEGAALNDDAYRTAAVDSALNDAIDRASASLDSAESDSARFRALFWLGTALGYRARQAELRGSYWRASRDARAMRQALDRALELDSTRVDCLLPLGLYDYSVARTGALARLVARIIGLGGGDAERGMARVRRAGEAGRFTRPEAQWVYANMLVREAHGDTASTNQARRIVTDLADRYPGNPVFRRFLETPSATP